MKTVDLIGPSLDWAVAKCEGLSTYIEVVEGFKPSTDWTQGGPIIERECIDLQYQGGEEDVWAADMFDADSMLYGNTPLIAAMRGYVAGKLGDTVEIPEELMV